MTKIMTRTGIFPNGWIKKSIEQVKEFNTRKRREHSEAVSKWNPANGGYPYLGFYIYRKDEDTGEERKNGYVVSWEHCEGGKGSRFYLHETEALKAFNTDII